MRKLSLKIGLVVSVIFGIISTDLKASMLSEYIPNSKVVNEIKIRNIEIISLKEYDEKYYKKSLKSYKYFLENVVGKIATVRPNGIGTVFFNKEFSVNFYMRELDTGAEYNFLTGLWKSDKVIYDVKLLKEDSILDEKTEQLVINELLEEKIQKLKEKVVDCKDFSSSELFEKSEDGYIVICGNAKNINNKWYKK